MTTFNPDLHHPMLFRFVDKKVHADYVKICANKRIAVSGSLTALLNKYMAEVVRLNK